MALLVKLLSLLFMLLLLLWKHRSLGSNWPGFFHLVAVWPWVRHVSFLSCHFPTSDTELITPVSEGDSENDVGQPGKVPSTRPGRVPSTCPVRVPSKTVQLQSWATLPASESSCGFLPGKWSEVRHLPVWVLLMCFPALNIRLHLSVPQFPQL